MTTFDQPYASSYAASQRRNRLPSILLSILALLLLAGVALAGCVAPQSGSGRGSDQQVYLPTPAGTEVHANYAPTATAGYHPDAAPPPSTLTAIAVLTVIPPPTEIPGLQATHVARNRLAFPHHRSQRG